MVHTQMEPPHPGVWLRQAVGDQIGRADDIGISTVSMHKHISIHPVYATNISETSNWINKYKVASGTIKNWSEHMSSLQRVNAAPT